MMLNVTDAAADLLRQMRNKAGAAKGTTVRLVVGKHGAELVLDAEKPGDTKILHGDETVLLYDKELTDKFENKTLDAQLSEGGAALVFR
jgi:hypothetical protein